MVGGPGGGLGGSPPQGNSDSIVGWPRLRGSYFDIFCKILE